MSAVYEKIKTFLQSQGIDTFSAIKSENLEVINERIMPENVKSAVMFLMPYYTGKHEERNVSLYAVGLDYHLYIRELSAKLCFDDGYFYKLFADTSPINERKAALDSGLGFKGRNGLVINEKYGSFVFVGTLLTDAVFDEDEYAVKGEIKTCMDCGRCVKECDFLSGKCDFCLSELNQRKNVTEDELGIILSKKIRWGCDACQEVCPYNKDVLITPVEFFHRELLEKVDYDMIENMSKDEFSKRAYAWRGKKTILRNLGEDN